MGAGNHAIASGFFDRFQRARDTFFLQLSGNFFGSFQARVLQIMGGLSQRRISQDQYPVPLCGNIYLASLWKVQCRLLA